MGSEAPGQDLIDLIVRRVKSYRTPEGARFVDREVEVRRLLGDPRVAGGGRITILYGPKGCGKTTLFRAIKHAVDGLEAGGVEVNYDIAIVGVRADAP